MKRLASLIGIGVSLFACLVSVSAPAAVLAATNPQNTQGGTGQALEIAPPLITLSANPGQTIKTQIKLRDVSKSKLIVTNEINDFTAAGEDGTPKILLNDDGNDNPYSLKGWISPLPALTLKPKEIKDLAVTIKVPANASPGGYYGIIRFTGTPPDLEGTGVSLSASLGALVMLRVNGDVKESLEIEEFFASTDGKKSGSLFESTPIKFVERLKNTGNIHEKPAGQIVIKDMFGKTVAAVNINLPPRNILPASIRKFEQPLDKTVIGNKKLFGRYTAELKVTYGDDKQTVTEKITFWVIPYKLIGIIIAALIVGFFLFRWLLRRYNRRIIRKAQSGGSSRSKRK